MKRLVIVTCTHHIANLLRAGKCLGASAIDQRDIFERAGECEVKLSSPSFAEVAPGQVIPRAVLEDNSDGTFKVVPL